MTPVWPLPRIGRDADWGCARRRAERGGERVWRPAPKWKGWDAPERARAGGGSQDLARPLPSRPPAAVAVVSFPAVALPPRQASGGCPDIDHSNQSEQNTQAQRLNRPRPDRHRCGRQERPRRQEPLSGRLETPGELIRTDRRRTSKAWRKRANPPGGSEGPPLGMRNGGRGQYVPCRGGDGRYVAPAAAGARVRTGAFPPQPAKQAGRGNADRGSGLRGHPGAYSGSRVC